MSTGNRASEYPLSNAFPGGRISARVGIAQPAVVNTGRHAKICAAMKSCTFCVVVALLSAIEASHLSGRQGWIRWGELGGYVDQLPGSLYCLRCTAVVLRQQQDAIADLPPPPLTAAAAEFHLTPQTI